MALQFTAYPYVDPEERRLRQMQVFNQTVTQPIQQGLATLLDQQRQKETDKRQKMMDQLLMDQQAREAQKYASEYGTLKPPEWNTTPAATAKLSLLPSGPTTMGNMDMSNMGATGTPGMVSRFRSWKQDLRTAKPDLPSVQSNVPQYKGIDLTQLGIPRGMTEPGGPLGSLNQKATLGSTDWKNILDYAKAYKDLNPTQKPSNMSMTGVTTKELGWESASPTQQNMARAMLEGRILPSDLGMRDRATIVGLANELAIKEGKPFQSYQGNVRKGMSEHLAYGKMGMNALSLNTALGHASDALKAYDNVKNTNEAFLNRPINWLRENTNDPDIIALGLNLNALRGELANVFKNSGGTDQEIAQWSNYLNENLTPSQYVSALGKVDELLRSRLSALEYQQQNVMTQPVTERTLLSPKGKKIMGELQRRTIKTEGQVPSFGSLEEADQAHLPPGTRISINGRMATVR